MLPELSAGGWEGRRVIKILTVPSRPSALTWSGGKKLREKEAAS